MIAAHMFRHVSLFAFIIFVTAAFAAPSAGAQDLFEIQVYPYETVEPGKTMVEMHTNFFPKGTTETAPGASPRGSAGRRSPK